MDENLRFYVDWWRDHTATVRDSHLIPRLKKCIASQKETQIFSALNAKWENWQFWMGDKEVNKTAFVTHHGLCKYYGITLGLKNTLETFYLAKK